MAKKSKSPAKIKGRNDYPRHALPGVLRIPKAILEQNAGKKCNEKDAAKYAAIGYGGSFRLEVSSAIKFGLLDRPETGIIGITDLARRILRPQESGADLKALREAVLQAPVIQEVYQHYRGEYLPERQFIANALVDKFGIPADKVQEFLTIFNTTLETAKLLEVDGNRVRLLDVSDTIKSATSDTRIKTLTAAANVTAGDSCFVMMPFAEPIGGYYEKIYEPAIRKAGLVPVRADSEIFGTGKIIDQIWKGINSAKVLVAELTSRNPNVFYELGLSHAKDKPVVLVSSTKDDVPFDLKHIRVIYYEVTDPFWGQKLIDKLSENILSALKNPEEAVFKRALENDGDVKK